jgi:hypothetical protein
MSTSNRPLCGRWLVTRTSNHSSPRGSCRVSTPRKTVGRGKRAMPRSAVGSKFGGIGGYWASSVLQSPSDLPTCEKHEEDLPSRRSRPG